jgi:predicted molibdopterin-dependent oxidoreductase YjgC
VTKNFSILLDGQKVEANKGETVLTVARRHGKEIPTLCHDDRLKPAGACRSCLVEVDGQRRMHPACAFEVGPDMAITTESDRIQRHRSVLLSMYLADHRADESDGQNPLPAETPNGNALRSMAQTHGPLIPLPAVNAPRLAREADANPYIQFDPEVCILCARCTRYCDEVEAVSAITLAERGPATTIATAGQVSLMDTTCELCGGCIATCPTGALIEKKAPAHQPTEVEKVRTTCNYCGVGCQMDLNVQDGQVIKVTSPPPGETVNDGNLCIKGRFAYDFIHHEDRLTQPLIRREDGNLHPAPWEEALDLVAKGLTRVKDQYGADKLGFISSSRCTGEENYLLQKLARAAFGTNNCHQCAAT